MEEQIVPFDLKRLFIGDEPPLFLLEILFRTGFMFAFVLIAARVIGKRGMKQLTPFEYIIVIALGSATGDPMFYPSVPLLHGVAVITLIVLLEKGIASIAQKSPYMEKQIESTPTMLIRKGKVRIKALKNSSLTKNELYMQLRMQKVRYLDEVDYAYLETSGSISVFFNKKRKEYKRSILPKTNLN